MATYSTTAQVKSVCWIQGWGQDTQYDDYLDDLRDQAYAVINMELRDYASVPFGGSEEDYDVLVMAERNIAAGNFLLSRGRSTEEGEGAKGQALIDMGNELVESYIANHFTEKGTERADRITHQEADDSWKA